MTIQEHYDFESEYYDKLYGDFRDDLFVIQSMIQSGRILEVFCGTGRLISNFRGGIGIDINRNMLIKARAKFIRVEGDAFNLPFKPVFHFAIIGLNSLLLFKDQDKKRILHEVNRVLVTGGRIFIDVINGFSLEEREYLISEYEGWGEHISLTMIPERIEDRYLLHYKYVIKKNGIRIEGRDLIIYPLGFENLEELLMNTGFQIKRIWGDYDLSPFSKTSDKILVEATKKY